jgi:hypothetical protein
VDCGCEFCCVFAFWIFFFYRLTKFSFELSLRKFFQLILLNWRQLLEYAIFICIFKNVCDNHVL